MNPTLYSKWQYEHEGQRARIKVVGIWGSGTGSRYQVQAYELKQDGKLEIDLVSAKKMVAMIKNGRLSYLAPGPEPPDQEINRVPSASPSEPVRSEANDRRRKGEENANESRKESKPGYSPGITEIKFKTQKL